MPRRAPARVDGRRVGPRRIAALRAQADLWHRQLVRDVARPTSDAPPGIVGADRVRGARADLAAHGGALVR